MLVQDKASSVRDPAEHVQDVPGEGLRGRGKQWHRADISHRMQSSLLLAAGHAMLS